jgi:soluble lytic murein transglycosylase-like protein
MNWRGLLIFAGPIAAMGSPPEHCINNAAAVFGHPPKLIHAIIKVESSGNCRAVGKNKGGSYDIGCMQINSSWIPKLQRQFGIAERDLYDPCTNIFVGAWILAKNKQLMGNRWQAIGAYNARSEHKRQAYAWRIYKALQQQR